MEWPIQTKSQLQCNIREHHHQLLRSNISTMHKNNSHNLKIALITRIKQKEGINHTELLKT